MIRKLLACIGAASFPGCLRAFPAEESDRSNWPCICSSQSNSVCSGPSSLSEVRDVTTFGRASGPVVGSPDGLLISCRDPSGLDRSDLVRGQTKPDSYFEVKLNEAISFGMSLLIYGLSAAFPFRATKKPLRHYKSLELTVFDMATTVRERPRHRKIIDILFYKASVHPVDCKAPSLSTKAKKTSYGIVLLLQGDSAYWEHPIIVGMVA